MRNDVVPLTDDDILDTIADIASRQNTSYVLIAALRVRLGLSDDDRDWLIDRLQRLDLHSKVLLSPVEKPQNLAIYQAPWSVRNASGIPCHEICLNPDLVRNRVRRLPRGHELPLQEWPKAKDESTSNPTMQKDRISRLIRGAAETLVGLGRPPQKRARILEGRAA